MVHRALAVASQLAGEGIEVEVIDPRTLVPLDSETILASLRRTHRIVVVTEDTRRAGVGAELMATILEEGFDELDAPVIRVCAVDTPIPFAPAAQDHAIPNTADILAAIRRVLE
jgi:pyruvate dehydrogenase E1 component beta subunit